jgi:hypothetical protein
MRPSTYSRLAAVNREKHETKKFYKDRERYTTGAAFSCSSFISINIVSTMMKRE